jgi:hypothetical protein
MRIFVILTVFIAGPWWAGLSIFARRSRRARCSLHALRLIFPIILGSPPAAVVPYGVSPTTPVRTACQIIYILQRR